MFTSTRTPCGDSDRVSSWRATDSDSTEWTSSDPADDVAHLAALQVADEVPDEEVTVRRLLGEKRVRLVLADAQDPGRVERRQILRADVLDGGENLDRGRCPAGPSRGLADRSTRGGDALADDLGIEAQRAPSM